MSVKSESKYEKDYYKDGICPFCGTVKEDIKINKKTGCAFCFEVFSDIIEEEIKRKLGHVTYKGRVHGKNQALVPVYRNNAIAVSSLSLNEAKKRLLEIAVKEERYEDAAILRDEIKELEKRDKRDDYAE
ncbi:MAG: UvrB/UvrC motif-containing protein [Clostridia bacterium]|nr:UvrB/UvrC motif-containing protein [Clostridia bacterium]